MLIDTEGGRAATYYAAWAADAEPDRLPMAAAMAMRMHERQACRSAWDQR